MIPLDVLNELNKLESLLKRSILSWEIRIHYNRDKFINGDGAGLEAIERCKNALKIIENLNNFYLNINITH